MTTLTACAATTQAYAEVIRCEHEAGHEGAHRGSSRGIEAVWTTAGTPYKQIRGESHTLTAAQTALRDAESHVQERRQELQAAVLQARQSRSLADIARELGVSKQRVEQISKGR